MDAEEIMKLKEDARTLRKKTLELAIESKDGHIASAYSVIELIIYIYEKLLRPQDKFILSKGHGCLSFYNILRSKGFNPKISGHPDIEVNQGIVCTTGSLGHGLPIGAGMALAKKLKKEDGKIFVVIGDGECQEGTTWETLNLARKFNLDNLTVILDHNKLQALDSIENIMGDENFYSKFESFGMNVHDIDGHDFRDISSAFTNTNNSNQPNMIIANTIKGKGLSFMENEPVWHNKIPEGELLEQANKELNNLV